MADQRSIDPASRLRQAREQKGLSIRQVAEATKLSVRAIETLERGAIAQLPEGIYRRAIIRAVASEVGLNADQVLAEFSSAVPDLLPAQSRAVIVEPKASASFSTLLKLAGAALPMVAGIIYFAYPITRAMLSEKPKGVVQTRRVQPAAAEVVPVGGFGDAAVSNTRPVPVVVTLTISSRCSLRVLADEVEIVNRTMEPGETVSIALGDELVLLGDNAAAVQFSINGQAGRLLGAAGDALSTRIGRDDYQDFLVRY